MKIISQAVAEKRDDLVRISVSSTVNTIALSRVLISCLIEPEPIDLSLASSQDDIEHLFDGGFVTIPSYPQAASSESSHQRNTFGNMIRKGNENSGEVCRQMARNTKDTKNKTGRLR